MTDKPATSRRLRSLARALIGAERDGPTVCVVAAGTAASGGGTLTIGSVSAPLCIAQRPDLVSPPACAPAFSRLLGLADGVGAAGVRCPCGLGWAAVRQSRPRATSVGCCRRT
jgi:hypothetical protein